MNSPYPSKSHFITSVDNYPDMGEDINSVMFEYRFLSVLLVAPSSGPWWNNGSKIPLLFYYYFAIA